MAKTALIEISAEAPCELGCKWRDRCWSREMACQAFQYWVMDGRIDARHGFTPSKEVYRKIYRIGYRPVEKLNVVDNHCN